MAGVLCLGLAVWDRIMRVGAIPQAPIRVYAHGLAECFGGPAALAATAIARLGGRARFLGPLGADTEGERIAAGLAAAGVEVVPLARPAGARSASAAVAADPAGAQLVLSFLGEGLREPPPEGMDWAAAFAGCGALLLDMGWPAGATPALAEARARGLPSLLDAELNPEAEGLFALADHLQFSAPALALLTEEEEDAATALAKVVARRGYRGSVGVTLAERGYCWLDDTGLHHAAAPAHLDCAAKRPGTGEVFRGAFALALAEGAALAAAARFANAAAALHCAGPGLPGRAVVDGLLREMGAAG